METGKNISDKDKKKEQNNIAATEKMAENDKNQTGKYQANQNELTQSENAGQDNGSLANNSDKSQANDSLHIKEQNKNRLKSEKDEDFGIE